MDQHFKVTYQIHQPCIWGLGTINPPKISQKVYTPEDSTAETWMFGVSATVMRPQQVKKSRLRKTKRKYQKNLAVVSHKPSQHKCPLLAWIQSDVHSKPIMHSFRLQDLQMQMTLCSVSVDVVTKVVYRNASLTHKKLYIYS